MQRRSAGSARFRARALYIRKCSLCHGDDGKLMASKSPDLSISTLSLEERVALITYGKGTMPGQKGILNKAEIELWPDTLNVSESNAGKAPCTKRRQARTGGLGRSHLPGPARELLAEYLDELEFLARTAHARNHLHVHPVAGPPRRPDVCGQGQVSGNHGVHRRARHRPAHFR